MYREEKANGEIKAENLPLLLFVNRCRRNQTNIVFGSLNNYNRCLCWIKWPVQQIQRQNITYINKIKIATYQSAYEEDSLSGV